MKLVLLYIFLFQQHQHHLSLFSAAVRLDVNSSQLLEKATLLHLGPLTYSSTAYHAPYDDDPIITLLFLFLNFLPNCLSIR